MAAELTGPKEDERCHARESGLPGIPANPSIDDTVWARLEIPLGPLYTPP